MKKIAVVGGGSSAYSLIALLSQAGKSISLLTSRPQEWSSTILCELYDQTQNLYKTLIGNIDIASSDSMDIIPDADIVIICAPVHTYNSLINVVLSSLHNRTKPLSIGTMYGQGGFDWMIESALKQHRPDYEVSYWAIGLLPWICRTKKYGSVGTNYGPKHRNVIATSSLEVYESLNEELLQYLSLLEFGTGGFERSDSFLSLTLSVDNQIIHPARCYGLGTQAPNGWNNIKDVPFFYRDFDEISTNIFTDLDDEYTNIKNLIKSRFPEHDFKNMMAYLVQDRFVYGVETSCIQSSFRESKTLWSIQTPVIFRNNKWQVDFGHRFFSDDIYYGLDIAKWFANEMSVKTPTLDKIREWAIKSMREQDIPVMKDQGSPKFYGINNIQEIKFI